MYLESCVTSEQTAQPRRLKHGQVTWCSLALTGASYSPGHPWRGVSSNAAFNISQETCLCLLALVFQFISFLTKWKLVANSTRGSKTLPGRIRRGSRTWNSLGASGDGASVTGDSKGKRALGTCINNRLHPNTPQWPTGEAGREVNCPHPSPL